MASENDYLTPEQIEAIRSEWAADQRARGTVNGPRPIDLLIAKLLRHLRALTAPADGEALGRELWAAVPVVTPVRWEDIEPWLRDRYRSHALKCHAIGHAAGALSREGEVAALRSESAQHLAMAKNEARKGMEAEAEIARLTAEIERREQDRAEGVADIDRLRGHLDLDMLASVNECADEGARLRREVERLTADLAAARDETTRWAAKEGIARADRDIAQTESARLKRRERDIIEACERVADGGQYRADIVSAINRIRSERDAARAELARRWQCRSCGAGADDGAPPVLPSPACLNPCNLSPPSPMPPPVTRSPRARGTTSPKPPAT